MALGDYGPSGLCGGNSVDPTIHPSCEGSSEVHGSPPSLQYFVQADTGDMHITTTQPLTVRALLESLDREPGVRTVLMQGGSHLDLDTVLQPGEQDPSYRLTFQPKRACRRVEMSSPVTQTQAASISHKLVLLLPEGPWFIGCSDGALVHECLRTAGFAVDAVFDPFTLLPVPADARVYGDSVFDARPILQAHVAAHCTDAAIWNMLQQLSLLAGASGVQLVPPAVTEVFLQEDSFAWPDTGTYVCGARLLMVFLHQGHWACLEVVMPEGAALTAVCYDGLPGRSLPAARRLAKAIAGVNHVRVGEVLECNVFQQLVEGYCGPVALLHAGLVLSGSLSALAGLLERLRPVPVSPVRSIGGGGLSTEQETAFHALLLDKGVPAELVDGRAKAALSKLGVTAVCTALASRNPWAQLKNVASRPATSFKFVLPDELSRHIESKAVAGFGVSKAKAKKQKHSAPKVPTAPLHVDPTKLELAAGTFVAQDGTPLHQIAFDDVVADARGVAFCSAGQLSLFLQGHKPLSSDPLGLVSTAEVSLDAFPQVPAAQIRFPVVFAPTQEAILLRGTLLQLGDVAIQLASSDIAELDQVDTALCKLSLCRDEVSLEWGSVVAAPIRALLQHAPGLTICADPSCKQDCPRFHPAVDESVDRLLLEVWGRQYSRIEGGKVLAQQAQVFSCMIRIPASALMHLNRMAIPGLYCEPRAASGTGPHPAYAVIWLPNADAKPALHAMRTCPKAVALARLGRKYGIRTREADEQAVFQHLRPGHDFIKVRVVHRFKLYPLPHGCQRHNLVQALKSWGWTAKPLQPLKGDSQGAAWEVGSSDEPPAMAFPLSGSYVLVCRSKDVQSATPVPPAVCASRRTRKMLIYDDDEDEPGKPVDPWSNGRDPWALSRAPPGLPIPASASSSAGSRIDQIRAELTQDINKVVQKQLAEQPSASNLPDEAAQRMLQLESGVGELRLQNAKFESWFAAFGKQVADAKQEVAEVKSALGSQQQDLGYLRGELAKQGEVVQASVQNAIGALQQDISAQLAAQFQGQAESFQAMLTKKLRTE